jgi:hypothetical protein
MEEPYEEGGGGEVIDEKKRCEQHNYQWGFETGAQ